MCARRVAVVIYVADVLGIKLVASDALSVLSLPFSLMVRVFLVFQ